MIDQRRKPSLELESKSRGVYGRAICNIERRAHLLAGIEEGEGGYHYEFSDYNRAENESSFISGYNR
ncbi:MAG: hypothetical protein ACR2MQ_02870 [Gemmatimonadaceae bacterium]